MFGTEGTQIQDVRFRNPVGLAPIPSKTLNLGNLGPGCHGNSLESGFGTPDTVCLAGSVVDNSSADSERYLSAG